MTELLTVVNYEGNLEEQTPEIIYYEGDYSECDKPQVIYIEGEPYIRNGFECIREEEYYAQEEAERIAIESENIVTEDYSAADAFSECDKSFVCYCGDGHFEVIENIWDNKYDEEEEEEEQPITETEHTITPEEQVIEEAEEEYIEEDFIDEEDEDFIEEDFIDEEDEDFIEEEYIDEDDEECFEWSIEDIEQPTELITEAVLPEMAEPTIDEPAAPTIEEPTENNNKKEIILSSESNTTDITTNSTKTDELHSLPGLYNTETETTAIANFEKLLIAEPAIKSFINEYEAALNYVQGLLGTIANTKRFKKVKFAKGAIYKTVEEYIKYINSCLWDDAITVIENAKLYIDNDAKSIEESKDIIIEIINTKNIMATIEMYTKTAEKVYSYCESQTSYLTAAPVKPKRLYSFNK